MPALALLLAIAVTCGMATRSFLFGALVFALPLLAFGLWVASLA